MHDVRDMEAMAKAADLNGKLDKVAQFNNLVVGFPIPERPQLLSEDRQAFRQGFLKEEMDEIDKAYREGDLEEVVDGHIDAIYVHLGALNEMGVTPGPCFDAVHEANIAKKRGAQSKRGRSGGFDAVKPPGWKPPSHAEFLTISTQDVRDLLDVRRAVASISWHHTGVAVTDRNRKADLRNITADELNVISKLRSGELKVDLNREERRREQQEAGRVLFKAETSGLSDKPSSGFEVLHTRQVKPNDDFEYVGYGSTTFEFKLLGEDGYVLSVDERRQQADVKFYRSDLPQLMTVSLREVKYKPKRTEQGDDSIRSFCAAEPRTIVFDKPKVLVLGYARHGKDTASELLRDKYGLSFTSSSAFCAERVVFPWFQANPGQFTYESAEACFNDRHNHRALWFDLITAFNTPDLSSLGRAIFAEHDVYCGLRNGREFHAVKNAGLYDLCIWVDASERVKEIESRESCTVEPWMADYVVDNNGSVEDLERNLDVLMKGWV